MIGNTTQLTYLTDPKFAKVATACSSEDVPNATCAPRQALPETTLYVPLEFWFCRNPGLALPLIGPDMEQLATHWRKGPLHPSYPLWRLSAFLPPKRYLNSKSMPNFSLRTHSLGGHGYASNATCIGLTTRLILSVIMPVPMGMGASPSAPLILTCRRAPL